MSPVDPITESVTKIGGVDISSNDTPRNRETVDIEHAYVRDDPRLWSKNRKNGILSIVASAALIATLGANIYNPAINDIKADLHATDQDISLSLSLFIIVQGNFPLFWSVITEIKVVATAKSIGLVIGMRCLQAAGASAVLTIGAATLADIYEPHERGTMMGIYYAAPLLGPSLGPLLGGIATQLFNWRATFWVLVIFGGVSLVTFAFFKDTFRRERSLAYQAALRRHKVHAAQRDSTRSSKRSSITLAVPPTLDSKGDSGIPSDMEKGIGAPSAQASRHIDEIALSLNDINPFGSLMVVIRRWNNIVILIASVIASPTHARGQFSNKYDYNALKIGFVLLAFGLGCMAGSLLGGRWSDRVLMRLKAQHGGQSNPEMRLESAKYAMPFLPLSCVAYAWLCQEKVHVAAVCVSLFLAGFFTIWIYSSTLAYIVDANTGRSSTAIATNSSFRGIAGFVAAEVAAPLQDSIGDGGLYTIWAGLLVITELLILLVIWKGEKWREHANR
ncbi:MFS general substrate transporter [Rickenella mellea]|uniref:MFS general substrate transporter n=1 Tax=Rickenella mellea TaxID=50990 RepID=A0A4Y7Q7X0_9AGAM|nr:MFS general substrate transporter [Rickenella mellea]